MNDAARCMIRIRNVYRDEYQLLMTRSQAFMVFTLRDGNVNVGDVLLIRELDDEQGTKTGRWMKGDVTVVKPIEQILVAGFGIRELST